MDTFITGDETTLPEAVRELLKEDRPLPPDTAFFEERFTLAGMARKLAGGLAMMAAGAAVMMFGFYSLFHPGPVVTVSSSSHVDWWVIGFGLVLAFAGWLFVSSLPAHRALGRRQGAGERTRYGLFLTPGELISRNSFDTTVIPRENFRGLAGRTVSYTFKGEAKSFRLPGDWVGVSAVEVWESIRSWEQATSQGQSHSQTAV